MTIADHKTIYFDKIERTNKLQTLVAIANAALNIGEKDKVQKVLELALDIFKEPKKDKLGSGSYVGTPKQWNSKYTLSRDFGLIEESKKEVILSEFGKRLARGEVSAKYFISVVMLNYIQIIDNKIINILYSILKEMDEANKITITKEELKNIADFNLNGEDENGYINGLFDILKDTYFFKKTSNDILEINTKLFNCKSILAIVNIEEINKNITEIRKLYGGDDGQRNWCKYLSKEKQEFKSMLISESSENKLCRSIDSEAKKINKERNRIIFGAPGTGKSYLLKEESMIFGKNNKRITFYPNYSYGQFVGTYKPVPDKDEKENEIITYKYVPGPFMKVLVEAKRTQEPCLLLIEEINRANVASVFGDVFQLLDRDPDGISQYEIEASNEMQKYLQSELGGDIQDYEKIKIPNNMYIWATMNSADQGVFPMDTAFKRRWEFEYINIDDNDDGIKDIKVLVGADKHEIKWNDLRKAINNILLAKCNVNEDKLLGPYFISKSILEADESGKIIDNEKFIRTFKSKVIMYLFEDAAGRQHRNKVFKNCGEVLTYSKICSKFDEIGEQIFGDDLNLEESFSYQYKE